MNNCFDCGGQIKMISKPGRIFQNKTHSWEVPESQKLPTCLSCGTIFKDKFLEAKIIKYLENAKKINPSAKLQGLTFIANNVNRLLSKPHYYFSIDQLGLVSTFSFFLHTREIFIGNNDQSSKLKEFIVEILSKDFPEMQNKSSYLKKIDAKKELIPSLKKIYNLWVNVK